MNNSTSSFWTNSYFSGWLSDRSPKSDNHTAHRKASPVQNAFQDVAYEGFQVLTRCAETGYFIGHNLVSLVGLSCTMLYAHVEYDEQRAGKGLHEYSIDKARAIHSSKNFQMVTKGAGLAFGCYVAVAVAVPLVFFNMGKCLIAGLVETSMVAYEFKNNDGKSEILEASREFWEATDFIGLDKQLHDHFDQYYPGQESFWPSYYERPDYKEFCVPFAQAVLNLGKAYFSVAREMATSASERVKVILPEIVRNWIPFAGVKQ